jgi:CMP/dCMP kinase
VTVVTIDGPAGAGKSTVARLVAGALGFDYLDTGAMYRELTAVALAQGADLADAERLAALVGTPAPDGTDLRAERISRHVSTVSAHPAVRRRMRELQRGRPGDVVLEGRDTGSVVRPDADVKVYLTASEEERAARRAGDLGLPLADVLASIRDRDRRDAAQSAAAPDAHVIDTTGLGVDDVVARVVALVRTAA